MSSRRRKATEPKPSNPAMMRAMQELRKGSRAQPLPSGKRYRRHPKHRKQSPPTEE